MNNTEPSFKKRFRSVERQVDADTTSDTFYSLLKLDIFSSIYVFEPHDFDLVVSYLNQNFQTVSDYISFIKASSEITDCNLLNPPTDHHWDYDRNLLNFPPNDHFWLTRIVFTIIEYHVKYDFEFNIDKLISLVTTFFHEESAESILDD